MNFDSFDDIEMPEKYKGVLLKNAKDAERNIYIAPSDASFHARAALEILCKALKKKHNLEWLRPGNGQPNLATMIDTCVMANIMKNTDAVKRIRDEGNDAAHPNNRVLKKHIVTEAAIKVVMVAVKDLFDLISETYYEGKLEFDEAKIPFDSFEVVRRVPKAENEIIQGDYNYFVKNSQDSYYYFQIFPRKSEEEHYNALGARGVLTGNTIKKDKKRRSYLLDVFYPWDLSENSDREYIAYSVYSDSFLLSEIPAKSLTEKQTLQIAIELLNALIELKRIGKGISLRNIQPGNVILTPDDDSYMASVVNMETAKINGYDATVYGSLKSLMMENPYLPREVRLGIESDNVQWEKVDVYSIAKIMLYCIDPSIVKGEVDEDDVYDNFSEEVAEILMDVFDSSVNAIDGAEEFMEKIQNAFDEL